MFTLTIDTTRDKKEIKYFNNRNQIFNYLIKRLIVIFIDKDNKKDWKKIVNTKNKFYWYGFLIQIKWLQF